MDENIKNFFMNLDNPNFLVMKLFLSVLNKMQDVDSCSKKVVDNIGVLSQYNIKFIDSKESFSYVFSEDDLSEIEFAIQNSGSEYIVCHELGHLLLDIFFRGQLPDGFLEVNEKCKKRLLDDSEYVSNMLKKYRDEVFSKLMEDIADPLGFYTRHPEEKEKYFKLYPDVDENEMIENKMVEHFALISAFDREIVSANKISNIIDGIFCGNNSFCFDYGNYQVDPILAMHDDEYFEIGDFGPLVMGFEEQFADYFVLRVYNDEMTETINRLHSLIGNEWFQMMDSFYDKLASSIEEKGKVYRHK